jgi:hypothetical protein
LLKKLEASIQHPEQLIRSIENLQETARKADLQSPWAGYDPSASQALTFISECEAARDALIKIRNPSAV